MIVDHLLKFGEVAEVFPVSKVKAELHQIPFIKLVFLALNRRFQKLKVNLWLLVQISIRNPKACFVSTLNYLHSVIYCQAFELILEVIFLTEIVEVTRIVPLN